MAITIVQKNKSKGILTWYARVPDPRKGSPHYYSLGTTSKAEAKIRKDERLKAGDFDIKDESDLTTLGEAVVKFEKYERSKGTKPRSIETMLQATSMLKPIFDRRISDLTKKEISETFMTASDRLSPITYRNRKAILSTFFNYLVDILEILPHNPIRKAIPRRKIPKKQRDFWTADQIDRIIANAPTPSTRLLYSLMAFAGLRLSEARAMCPGKIHDGYLHVKGKGGKGICVVRIDIAQEIPGRSCPLRHGIGFALCIAPTLGTLAIDKGIDLCQGALTALTRLKMLDGGKLERKLAVRNGNDSAGRTVNDRDRLTPVSLTVKCPILHLVLHAQFTDSALGQMLDHASDGILFVGKSVEEIGVDHLTVTGISLTGNVASLDHLYDINTELLSKGIVTLIVRGNCHDRTRAVAHHNVVGGINRDLFLGNGIDGGQPLNTNARLILHQLRTLKLGLLRAFLTVCIQSVHVSDLVSVRLNDRMLGCDDHKGNSEERIGTRGVDAKLLIKLLDREIDKRTCGFSDPVDLLLLDVGKIINLFKSVQKLIGILGDPQVY